MENTEQEQETGDAGIIATREGLKGNDVQAGAEYTRDTNYIQDRIVADPDAVCALPTAEPAKVGRVGGGLTEGAISLGITVPAIVDVPTGSDPWGGGTAPGAVRAGRDAHPGVIVEQSPRDGA